MICFYWHDDILLHETLATKGVKINSVAYVAIKRNLLNIIPLISVSANDASVPSRFLCRVRNGVYTCSDKIRAASKSGGKHLSYTGQALP